LLDGAEALTAAGVNAREAMERATDQALAPALQAVGDDDYG